MRDLDDDIYNVWVEQKPVRTSDMSQERVDETPKEWVGLTDEETQYLIKHFDWRQSADHFVALIEAKLKEKNNGN